MAGKSHKMKCGAGSKKYSAKLVSALFLENAAVPISSSDSLTTELKRIQKENKLLRDANTKLRTANKAMENYMAQLQKSIMKIPKPKGKVGCLGDNDKKPGYHLQERKGLSENNDLYNRIRDYVRAQAHAFELKSGTFKIKTLNFWLQYVLGQKGNGLGKGAHQCRKVNIRRPERDDEPEEGADFDPFSVLRYPDEQEDRSSNGSGDEDGDEHPEEEHSAQPFKNKNKTASVLKDQLNRSLTKHKTSSIQPLKAPNLDLSEGVKMEQGHSKYTLSDGRVLTLDAYPKSLEHYDEGFCDGVIRLQNVSNHWKSNIPNSSKLPVSTDGFHPQSPTIALPPSTPYSSALISSPQHLPGWLSFKPKPQLPQTPLKAQMKSVTVVRVIDSPLSSVVDSPKPKKETMKSKLVLKAAKAIKKRKLIPEVSSVGTRSSKCKYTDDIAVKVPMPSQGSLPNYNRMLRGAILPLHIHSWVAQTKLFTDKDSIYLEDGTISILHELSKDEYPEILVLNITKNVSHYSCPALFIDAQLFPLLHLSVNHFDAHSSPRNNLNLPTGNLQLYFKLDPEDAHWKWAQYRALIETLTKQTQGLTLLLSSHIKAELIWRTCLFSSIPPGHITVMNGDLVTLEPGGWLNDTIIELGLRTPILTFDSMGTHHPRVQKILEDYLISEAYDKRNVACMPSSLYFNVPVPIQTNGDDYGIYLMLAAETFTNNWILTKKAINNLKGNTLNLFEEWNTVSAVNAHHALKSKILTISQSSSKTT
ncbi:hypothetical protein JB92DRAFT_3125319 [Gautieria morchelliformis]|nr:hypothetical protein JB92DRAFT_3125319 [Gautieria morchelliformis]